MTITATTDTQTEQLEALGGRIDTALVGYAALKFSRAADHIDAAHASRNEAISTLLRILATRAFLDDRQTVSLPMRPQGHGHPVLLARPDFPADLAALFDAHITFGELFHVLPCEAFSRDEAGLCVTFVVDAIRAAL